MGKNSDIADLLRGFKALQRLIDAEPEGVDVRWVDQTLSPLGRRVHIAAVRRRLADAEARGVSYREVGAAYDPGKGLYTLSQESLAEEIGHRTARGMAKARAKRHEKRLDEMVDDTSEDEAYRRVVQQLRAVEGGRR